MFILWQKCVAMWCFMLITNPKTSPMPGPQWRWPSCVQMPQHIPTSDYTWPPHGKGTPEFSAGGRDHGEVSPSPTMAGCSATPFSLSIVSHLFFRYLCRPCLLHGSILDSSCLCVSFICPLGVKLPCCLPGGFLSSSRYRFTMPFTVAL